MWLELFQEIKQRKILLISLLYTLFLICIALVAPIISPYEVSEQNLSLGASAPSLQYILGTDVLGRDLFSRILYGSRISLLVGFLATFVAITIGLSYGAVSGYFGGKIDSLMMRAVDILDGLPFVVFITNKLFGLYVLNKLNDSIDKSSLFLELFAATTPIINLF